MKQFDEKDVITVAKAMLESHTYFSSAGNSMRDYDKHYCLHCSGHIEDLADVEKLKHDINCPVLIARDLLT